MTDRPNILLIMTDQHRADLMTCAGRDLVPTPNIDRIASRGVRFTNAYCPYPACVASRSSLLTGLYAHTTGAINNTDRLDWRFRTVADHFADNGYLTGLIGKMHFNDAHNHGFEYSLSINDWLMYLGPKVKHYAWEVANHPLVPSFFDTILDDGAGLPDVADLWEGPSPWVGRVERHDFSHMASRLEAEDHLDMFVARESVKFMQRYSDQPFFLVSSLMKPHSPFYPPKEWADPYPVNRMELPAVGNIEHYPPHIQNRIRRTQSHDEMAHRAHRAGYLGNLAFVDTCIGLVLDALSELSLWDDTILVYTSDHGEMDGDHGLYQKFCLFEPAVKVPLIISYPKVLPENKVTDALTEYIGIYPTLLELTGIDFPESTTQFNLPNAPRRMDAVSFADSLRRPASKGPSAVFSEYNLRGNPAQYMVRTARYKYVFNQDSKDELYDLEADPGENLNCIDDANMNKKIEELRERLFAWYDPGRNPYGPSAKKR